MGPLDPVAVEGEGEYLQPAPLESAAGREIMSRLRAVASAIAVPIALVGLVCLGTDQAQAQNTIRTVYSAKFLCGEFGTNAAGTTGGEGVVKPGNYLTAINLVNPNNTTISFVKKAVLLYDSFDPNFNQPGVHEVPRRPGNKFQLTLLPNWGAEIDCSDIREVLLCALPPCPPPPFGAVLPFIKGFVELETVQASNQTFKPLEVVAAYTSHGFSPRILCDMPGSIYNGQPCATPPAFDPCTAAGGSCVFVPPASEGFATDIERVPGTRAP